LRANDPPEHIIPEAMGGTLKTDRVCRGCNEQAGKAIDAPFMRDWLIAMDRALHSPKGDRLRPRVDAALEDGTPVDLGTGKGPWKATVRASIEWNGDEVVIRASNRTEYEKLLARVRRKIEEEGREFTDPGEPTEVADSGLIVVRTKLDGVIWLRMAAKITLGCLSLVLDERWLGTADAAKYQGWLWDEVPVNEDGSTALGLPSSASELDHHVLAPPEHLLYFAPLGPERVGLSIAYFGSIILRAAVDLGNLPMPRAAWRTRPGAPPTETTFDALLAEAAVKYIEAHEED
jgi:hypothetical protein